MELKVRVRTLHPALTTACKARSGGPYPLSALVHLEVQRMRFLITAVGPGTQFTGEVCGEELETIKRGQAVVHLDKLVGLLKSLDENAIVRLRVAEGLLKVKTDIGDFELKCLPSEAFPLMPETEPTWRWNMDGRVLGHILSQVRYAASRMEDSPVFPVLAGVHLRLEPGRLIAESCDRIRVAFAEAPLTEDPLPSSAGQAAVVIPANFAERVISVAKGPIAVELNSKFLRIVGEDFCICSVLVEGAYPDLQAVCPQATDEAIEVDGSVLLQAMARASLLLRPSLGLSGGAGVDLEFEPDRIRVRYQVEDAISEESLPARCQLKASIGIKPSFLEEVLRTLKGHDFKVRLARSATNAIILDSPETGSRHILLGRR